MASIGIVAPGAMGAAVGRALREKGHRVLTVLGGRSDATRARARSSGFEESDDLGSLVARSEIVISVVPPAVAAEVAVEVARAAPREDRRRVYVDANAISPATARAVSGTVSQNGLAYVDGGIIGGPPSAGGRTVLALSGAAGEELARVLEAPGLQVKWLGPDPVAASALKMVYAAWSKGTSALLLEIRAAARAYGVDPALVEEWQRSQPDALRRSERSSQIAAKAWRWDAEMLEIARTLEDVGLPAGAYVAAAEVYGRLAGFKDEGTAPSLETMLAALAPRRPTERGEGDGDEGTP